MHRMSAYRRAVTALALVCLAGPVVAQGQPMPAPPVPGPYQLAPVPMGSLDTDRGIAPVAGPRFGPPQEMALPYWMRQPNQPAEAETAMPENGTEAPATTLPTFAPQAAPAQGAGNAYGRAPAPGFFPGYAMPQGPVPGAGAPSSATGVTTAPQMAPAPQAYQPYVPQPYGPPRGWGWGAPQGWTQPQPWGGGQ